MSAPSRHHPSRSPKHSITGGARSRQAIAGRGHVKYPMLLKRLALFVTLCLTLASLAAAQSAQDKKREADLKTVHGHVVDVSDNPVPTGIVYLKNTSSQNIKTYIADDSGVFRFSGLDPNTDYEIYAERNDMCSVSRTISNYDSRKDIDITLKLAHKCPK
jgi:hypothetical protein